MRFVLPVFVQLIVLCCVLMLSFSTLAQSSSFTYQGQLRLTGEPFTGLADLEFRLFDQSIGGAQIGNVQALNGVPVEDGLFQVELDFGGDAFVGGDRFLDIAVDGATLDPRQRVSVAPIALSLRGVRTEPSTIEFQGQSITANVISGSGANEVTAGARGVTIGGGGAPVDGDPNITDEGPNRVTENYSTVSGGLNNIAGVNDGNPFNQPYATVGGGIGNRASGSRSTIGGGGENTVNAPRSVIAGGSGNEVGPIGSGSVIGGGQANTILDAVSTIAGGQANTASGFGSTVSGGELNIAGGLRSTVAGGYENIAQGDYSVVSGRRAINSDPAHDGVFMFADSQAEDFNSTASDQFLVRASGGAVITANSANGDPNGNRLRVDGTLRVDALGIAGSQSLCYNNREQIASCSSSARYKQDITELELGLDTALQLQAVGYRWKESDLADIGFVAEDIAAIDERLVTRNETGEVESVKYGRLTAVLANAVQEMHRHHADEMQLLQAELTALRHETQQLQVLKDQNAMLEARLAALEFLLVNTESMASANE